MVYGRGLLQVEWYASFRQLAQGLEKNLFAGTDYRVGLTLAGILFNMLAFLGPYGPVVVTSGWTQAMFAACIAVPLVLLADSARLQGLPVAYALAWPLMVAVFTYLVARTLVKNLAAGGIVWRGTFYPLAQLRRNRV